MDGTTELDTADLVAGKWVENNGPACGALRYGVYETSLKHIVFTFSHIIP